MKATELRESKYLELKELPPQSERKNEHFKSYLKTVSAFANYDGGTIIFGITDDKIIKPAADPEGECLYLENQINDSIYPNPNYSFDINDNGTISLHVKGGDRTPYLYKGKAYLRNDSATIEVDRREMNRLILKGENLTFEELPSPVQQLSFHTLSEKVKSERNLSDFTEDTLRTLQLLNPQEGYSNAGFLLSDQNNYSSAGLIAYGISQDEIKFSRHFSGSSILKMLDEILDSFTQYYSYEKITGTTREVEIKIPEVAFREAAVNAFVHRDWTVNAEINFSFFSDRAVITSPGGLPLDITVEDYLNREISIPRNHILANVFNLLHLIEAFGTGVGRIKRCYQGYASQPVFNIGTNSIEVILPVIQDLNSLTHSEKQILALIRSGVNKKAALMKESGLSTYMTQNILNQLLERKLIEKEGNTKAVRYYPVE